MSEKKSGWTKVATVMTRKDGKGTYMKINAAVTLTEGQILTIQNPRQRPGITEEQLAKIPDFVKAEVYLAPARD